MTENLDGLLSVKFAGGQGTVDILCWISGVAVSLLYSGIIAGDSIDKWTSLAVDSQDESSSGVVGRVEEGSNEGGGTVGGNGGAFCIGEGEHCKLTSLTEVACLRIKLLWRNDGNRNGNACFGGGVLDSILESSSSLSFAGNHRIM